MMKKNPPLPRWKRFLQNSALVCAAVVITFALAELVLSLFVKIEKSTVMYDALLGLQGRPHVTSLWTREIEDHPLVIKTNRYGFHDVEHTLNKPPGRQRIVFIGDSYVEAYQVPLKDNFVRRLQKDFDASGWRVEALNNGLHTWGLGTYYLYVKNRLMVWNPDAVVLCLYMGNDLHDNYHLTGSGAMPRFAIKSGRLKQYPPPPYSAKLWMRDSVVGRSTLLRFLWLRVIGQNAAVFNIARRQGIVGSPEIDAYRLDDARLQEINRVAELQLIGIRDFLKQRGVRLFVFVIPDPRWVNTLAGRDAGEVPDITKKHAAVYEAGITGALDRAGIPSVYPRDDFVAAVRGGRAMYLHGGGHLTAAGHEQAAAALAGPLRQLIGNDGEPAEAPGW